MNQLDVRRITQAIFFSYSDVVIVTEKRWICAGADFYDLGMQALLMRKLHNYSSDVMDYSFEGYFYPLVLLWTLYPL